MTDTAINKPEELESGVPDTQQLAEINRFTRRSLKAEEVFVFSVILCDNEIDRDHEQFTVESLERLGGLFVGKTGVFDHNPKAQNQSARIFETRLVKEALQNSQGEPYCCLKAWAYMLRTEKNADLIREIDGGIKKEVSVGCAVEELQCSICNKDQKKEACAHKKGKRYGKTLCYYRLITPSDAYEWSFVAVPAQKNAGVVKRYGANAHAGAILLEKWVEAEEDTPLNEAQARSLREQCKALRTFAEAGEEYLGSLRQEVIKLALLSQPELEAGVMEAVAGGMSLPQLQAFRKAFLQTAARHYPVTTQLGRADTGRPKQEDAQFKI